MTTASAFIALGECLLELGPGESQPRPAGDAVCASIHFRRHAPDDWDVYLATALGDDPYSDDVVATLRQNDIRTTWVQRLPGELPGLYTIRKPAGTAGDRHSGAATRYYWRAASPAKRLFTSAPNLGSALAEAACLYLSGISLAMLPPRGRDKAGEVARAVRRAGKTVAFDLSFSAHLWSPADARRAVDSLLPACTQVFGNVNDVRTLFGDDPVEALSNLHRRGVREVVLRNGVEDVQVSTGAATFELQTDESITPVDLTGSDEAFNGVYLARRLTGGGPEDAALAGLAAAQTTAAGWGALPAQGDTGD